MQWENVKKRLRDVEVVGLAVAIVLAWLHSKEIRHTIGELKRIEKTLSRQIDGTSAKMTAVEKSMSTRSLGTFPDFVDEVQNLVKNASREVTIACDYAAYGEFDGKGLPIRQAIEDRINAKVPIHLTLLSKARRRHARLAQFPATQWAGWIASADNRRKVLEFIRSHGGDPEPLTHDALLDTLTKYDQLVQEQTFRGADIEETDVDMPLLFWIADGDRAVLVIQTYGGEQESAFWTNDLRLITALRSIAARYRQFPPPSTSSN